MTIPNLAEAGGDVTLSQQEAAAIAETYNDACERCHTLAQELAAERAETARLRAVVSDQWIQIRGLEAAAEDTRVKLAAALRVVGTAAVAA